MSPPLSPELSQENPSSFSPVAPATFPSQGEQQKVPRSVLETLQEQQLQFQARLLILQHQQRQIQATVAAVVASTSAPLLTGMSGSSGSGPCRPSTTPDVQLPGASSAGRSPGYFSPLTSPALESSKRPQYYRYPPAFGLQLRALHPLSSMSSPALNPVGSSDGAQQTLAPALEPQNSADMPNPDYIGALSGMLDENPPPETFSLTIPTHHPSAASPVVSTSMSMSGTGLHCNSLPTKSRPSPMLRQTHRSRQPSSNHTYSPPNSLLVAPEFSVAQPMTHPPLAAIAQRALQQHFHRTGPASLTSSTLSSVDLSQIMPPPPVPDPSPKAVTPTRPANLMNLGNSSVSGSASVASSSGKGTGTTLTAERTKPPTSLNKGIAKKPPIAPAPKEGDHKAVRAGTQRLAIHPSGTVGVRAATKAAADAIAVALNPPEGENGKTSHKAAEQKRRDSLKAGFDELRLLLPPINTEVLDPESGEPIPGSSAPRLLPKSSLVPDDSPNRGVSKVALLKFSNEYIVRLYDKLDRRDAYVEKLRAEIARLRNGGIEDEVLGDAGEDLLEIDMAAGEEDAEEEEPAGDKEMEDVKEAEPTSRGTASDAAASGASGSSRAKSVGKSLHLGSMRSGISGNSGSTATVTLRGKREN